MSWLAATLLAQAATAAMPPSPLEPARPLGDIELSRHRGGFSLPNGIDIALAVQTETKVDGAIVLRTVFEAHDGPPTFTTYVPVGERAATAQDAGVPASEGSGAAPPVITFDGRNGLQVTPRMALPNVSVGMGGEAISKGTPEGFAVVDPARPLTTDAGTVDVSKNGSTYRTTLTDSMLSLAHLAGRAFGAIVENSANDRTIDVQTTVDLDLRGASSDLIGSTMFRVEDTALDALRFRIP